jgi:hypothetical protein
MRIKERWRKTVGFNVGVEKYGSVQALILPSLNAGFVRETIVRKFPHVDQLQSEQSFVPRSATRQILINPAFPFVFMHEWTNLALPS